MLSKENLSVTTESLCNTLKQTFLLYSFRVGVFPILTVINTFLKIFLSNFLQNFDGIEFLKHKKNYHISKNVKRLLVSFDRRSNFYILTFS